MADAATLISNQGNPLLGFGSNADIPVSTPIRLDAINEASKNAMLANVARQTLLFKEKVKEHDHLLNLLQSGDLKIGDHLDRDTPVVKKALDDLDNAYFERAKKGFNNLEAAREYNKKLREANNVITQAQSRYVVDKKVQQDAADQTLPSERESIIKNHEGYLGKFWSDYKPAVKAVTLDHPGMISSILRDSLVPNSGVTTPPQTTHKTTTKMINGKLTTIDVATQQPVKPGSAKGVAADKGGELSIFSTVPGKYYDYKKMLANAADDFHDEKQRLNQTKYMDFVLNQTDPVQLKGIVDQANSRIKAYNEQRGITDEKDPNYVTPLDIVVAPDGSRHTTLSVPEFNAKMTLATIPGDYVEKDKQVFDKDVANYLEDVRGAKAKEAIDWYEAKTGRINANRLSAAAKVNTEVANSALYYAKGLFDKLNTIKDKDGYITGESLKKLTADELNYLGTGATTNNQFTITPLSLEGKVIKVNSDGTIQVGTKGRIFNKEFEPEFTIQQKTVALNKLGDEMLQTTGKEGYNFNTLTPLYEAIDGQGGAGDNPTGKTYLYNGKSISYDKIEKAAKQSGLSVEDYVKQFGIKQQ